jgi:hypothetical protein
VARPDLEAADRLALAALSMLLPWPRSSTFFFRAGAFRRRRDLQRSATRRPAPRSGTRSSTGCSRNHNELARRHLRTHQAIVDLIGNTITTTG